MYAISPGVMPHLYRAADTALKDPMCAFSEADVAATRKILPLMDFVKGVRDLLDQKKGTAKGRTLGAITIHLRQLEMLNLNAQFSQITIEVGATDQKLMPLLEPLKEENADFALMRFEAIYNELNQRAHEVREVVENPLLRLRKPLVYLAYQELESLAKKAEEKYPKCRAKLKQFQERIEVKRNVLATSEGRKDEKLPALPPELVQIALSYLDEDTHARAPAPMFELLAQDASGEALKKYTDTNAQNEAIVENIIQIIIADGKIPPLDSNAVAAAASVRYIPNLNLTLQACIAADKRTKIYAFVGQYCTNLRTLDLTKVHPLTPADLKLFSPLQSLRNLCLLESDIGDAHVEALSCLKLETCDLSKTRITGSTLNTLHRGITNLSLGRCRALTDAGVAQLGKTKDASGVDVPAMQLLTCDLSFTRITGSTLNTLHRGITDLSLHYCKHLTDAGVAQLGKTKDASGADVPAMQLLTCNLGWTPITGSTLNTLHRGITNLSLGGCRTLTDAGVAKLGKTKDASGADVPAMQLLTCDLSFTRSTGSTLNTLHRGITNLSLCECHALTDAGVAQLGKTKDASGVNVPAMQLSKCELGSTSITGSTLNTLHRGITNLSLCGCRALTDAGVAQLGKTKDASGVDVPAMQLLTCNLSDTSITGSTLNTLYRGITAFILRSCRKLTDAGVAQLGKTKDASGADVPAMPLLTCDLSYTPITEKTFNTFHREIINY